MTPGRQVLIWADQNQYRLSWIAEQIGYPAGALYEELHHDRISRELADALRQRFGLQVLSIELPNSPRDDCQKPY
ncbi:hypothetical protein [Candidatus Entotheonella palauensis]|uniref:hypothetical protein n=1 Tax=Candidatus Entotheonella palauensis TaxID=93172 RepID=UPI000B7EB7D2|nr:hypothetical protein [Candidatus Entotheonella palauensis]